MGNRFTNLPDDMGIMNGRAYSKILYLSKNGDGSDGCSWNTAYNTITDALGGVSADASELTVIYVNAGTYDVDTTGDPTFAKNVAIKGAHRHHVEFINDHAASTAVFKFTRRVVLENITINCWNNTNARNNNGVIIDGANANGSRLRKVYMECDDCTGAHTAVELTGTTKYHILDEVMFDGPVGNSTFLKFSGCTKSLVQNCIFNAGLTGINLSTTADAITFNNLEFHANTTAIILAAGADSNHFEAVHFANNTTNINQSATSVNTVWHNLHWDNAFFQVLPNGGGGTALATGDGVWVQTPAYTDIVAANTITKPFYVTGVFVGGMQPADMYYFEMTWDTPAGGADTVFCETMIKGSDNRSATAVTGISSGLLPANSAVSAKIASDSNGVDPMVTWIQYITV